MDVDIIASTVVGNQPKKKDLDILSGQLAGICYMPNDFSSLQNEPVEITEKRLKRLISGGHHSVFGHAEITFYLDRIPKALAMVLNNEKEFNTSEKSARYTKMAVSDTEKVLYDKWVEKFKCIIRDKYQSKYPEFMKDGRIEKLAQENARYLISIFTPTSMAYTTSYRQINYLYHYMKNEIKNPNKNEFYSALTPYMEEFCEKLDGLGIIDGKINSNIKRWKLSLINQSSFPMAEYFGQVYATTYKGTFAQFAQAQRHRSIDYDIKLLTPNDYYIPPIIASSPELRQEWLADARSCNSKFLQGNMVEINERGTYNNFIRKMQERKCTFAQLEINEQTNLTLHKYLAGLRHQNSPLAEDLMQYTRGSRCTFPNFTCTSPCGFAPGINESRTI